MDGAPVASPTPMCNEAGDQRTKRAKAYDDGERQIVWGDVESSGPED
jgi:hypothetical protein